jgi:Williams-Beuren syndrome DDT (WSD), D-TOX E motif
MEESTADLKLLTHRMRSTAMGQDRFFNKFWHFLVEREVVYVEGEQSKTWRAITTQEQLKQLQVVWTDKGVRERDLLKKVDKNQRVLMSWLEAPNKRARRTKTMFGFHTLDDCAVEEKPAGRRLRKSMCAAVAESVSFWFGWSA